MPIHIVLSYFDSKIGPRLLLSLPETKEIKIEETLLKIFDIELDSNFYELKLEEQHFLNYRINIPSFADRGRIKRALLSVILSDEHSILNWKSVMEDMTQEIESIPNISEIFKKNPAGNPMIQMKLTKIQRIFRKYLQIYKEKENQHPYGERRWLG